MTNKQLAQELDNALQFDPWIEVRGVPAVDLAKKLAGFSLESKERKRANQHITQANILLANFINCFQKGNRWLAIDCGSDAYPGGRYKKPVTKAVLIDGLVMTLKEKGLIDYKAGFYSREDLISGGKKTRIRPVGYLKSWIENISDAEIVQRPLGELVRVQEKGDKFYNIKTRMLESKKELKDYKDSDFTNDLRRNLKALNDFIAPVFVDVWLPDEAYKKALYNSNYYHKQYYCVFNDPEFKKGGRLYGHYIQQIKKDYRSYITINHVATQEVDYKGFHAGMMYHLEGAEMEGDPYQLDIDIYEDSLRDAVKIIFVIMLNCTSKKQAEKAIRRAIKEGVDADEIVLIDELDIDIQITTIMDALLDKHQVIGHWFFQPVPAGLQLQLLDSKITMGVMLEMKHKHDAVALSVHDSFIVQMNYTEALLDVMRDVYRQELGYIPQVELTGTKLKYRIDEGSASSHSFYEKNAIQYLKNKGVVPEYPLEPPSICPPV